MKLPGQHPYTEAGTTLWFGYFSSLPGVGASRFSRSRQPRAVDATPLVLKSKRRIEGDMAGNLC